jgi:hypothetical protein
MIRNKRGEGYIQVCVLIIVICMILAVIITFANTYNVVRLNESNAKTVLESFVTKNSIRIYDSIKQGSNETRTIDADEYVSDLIQFCTFAEVGDFLYHNNADGETDYFINKPKVEIIDGKLKITASFNVYVPMYFNRVYLGLLNIPLTVKIDLEKRY